MNFYECSIRLKELYNKRFSENESYTKTEIECNEVFLNLIKASVNEKKYFSSSPLEVFIIHLNETLENSRKNEIDFDENEYIKKLYLEQNKVLTIQRHNTQNNQYYFITILNQQNYNLFISIIKKRIDYIEILLFKKGIDVIKNKNNSIPELGWNGTWKISFKRDLNIIIKNEINQSINILNPKHENMFCNNGFVLFEHILNEYVKPTKGRQSDLIYYYWKMYENEPQYIHQRPTEFFNWFEKEYKEITGQLKTLLQVVTPQRNKDFSNALSWFKQQNK